MTADNSSTMRRLIAWFFSCCAASRTSWHRLTVRFRSPISRVETSSAFRLSTDASTVVNPCATFSVNSRNSSSLKSTNSSGYSVIRHSVKYFTRTLRSGPPSGQKYRPTNASASRLESTSPGNCCCASSPVSE